MQGYDLLLAGDPASAEVWHDHTVGARHSGYENHREDARPTRSRRPQNGLPGPAASPTAAEKVLRSFNTWAFKREQPSDPRLMLELIEHAMARFGPLSFVLYWGKGPRCRIEQPDIECLDFLASLAERVRKAHLPGAVLNLLFTDTHAKLNGYAQPGIEAYFSAIDTAARERGFATFWLSGLTRVQAPDAVSGEPLEPAILSRLIASARKWYRGAGRPEDGALVYYRMNMAEKRAVEAAFARAIFITFSGSELRSLFPEHLPIFYMYSLRRGTSVKPWFLPAPAPPCPERTCNRRAASSSR
jgi:hypothetical protein